MFSIHLLVILGTAFLALLLILNQGIVIGSEAHLVPLYLTFSAFIRHYSDSLHFLAPSQSITFKPPKPISLANNFKSIKSRSSFRGLVPRSVESGDICTIDGQICKDMPQLDISEKRFILITLNCSDTGRSHNFFHGWRSENS